MRQAQEEFEVRTTGPGPMDLTERIRSWISEQGLHTGLLTLFCRHTSASLLIMENYDPEVGKDLERWLRHAVPPGWPTFRHTAEGPDDMPAHVRTMLAGSSIPIPLRGGELALGRWQGIWLYEHRDSPHSRRIVAHLLGEEE